jgi:hypothetical protein
LSQGSNGAHSTHNKQVMSSAGGYYEGEFDFTLSRECRFIQIQPPPGFKLDIKDNNKGTKSVYGFTITTKASTEDEVENLTYSGAKRFVDILAWYSGGDLSYTLTSDNIRPPVGRTKKITKSIIFKYDIDSPEIIDLSQGNFPNLIETPNLTVDDQDLVDRLSHINYGLYGARNRVSEVMIKEFYLAIEGIEEAKKYRPLRNALSHRGKLWDVTIKELKDNFKNVNFDLPNGIFDHSSPKNIELLRIYANELRNIAMDYIRKELQKQKSSIP